MQSVISVAMIVIGAAIMLGSVIKSGDLIKFAPLVSEKRRSHVVAFLRVHRVLMLFFLIGYAVVAATFLFDLRFVGELFVGAVFLFGAAFVFMGVALQRRMLLEMRSTIHGIVPMCSRCNKVRTPNTDPEDRDAWIGMEALVGAQADASSFCPSCMDELYGITKEMRAEQRESD